MFLAVEEFEDKSQSGDVASAGLLYVCLWPHPFEPHLYNLRVLFLSSGCVLGKKMSSINRFNMCLNCFTPVRVVVSTHFQF